MPKDFEREILFSNISFLLKSKDVKIGELESYAGVSTGYISRMNKEPTTKPGIEFIVKVADKFNVSVDSLISTEMEKLTNTEMYLMQFLEKLKKDTEAEKLLWIRDTATDLEDQSYGLLNSGEGHPLFYYETVRHPDDPTDESLAYRGPVFRSNLFGEQTAINGSCYSLRLKNGTLLCLMDITKRFRKTNDTDVHAKEVWVYKYDAGKQFLCSSKTAKFADAIEMLFAAINEYMQHPQIKSDFRYSIDAFMNDDLQDDLGSDSAKTWTPADGEIPF